MVLTLDRTVARDFLRHQRPLLVLAVNLDDALPALAALGSGQSGNGLLPADLALRPLPVGLRTRRQRGRPGPLRLEEGGILIGALSRCRDGQDVGLVGSFGKDRSMLYDFISQHALVLFQLLLAVCGSETLTLRPRSQVAVAVDVVKVFGNRVLVVVAVGTETVGTVDILQAEDKN